MGDSRLLSQSEGRVDLLKMQKPGIETQSEVNNIETLAISRLY